MKRPKVYWLAYLEDLASMPDFKPGERTLAQAMIWERLGRHWAEAGRDDECDCEECRRTARKKLRAMARTKSPASNGRIRRGRGRSSASTRRSAWRPVLRPPTMPWPKIMSSGNKRMPRPKFIGGCWRTFPTTSTRSSFSSTITANATRPGGPRLCLAGPPPQAGQRRDARHGRGGAFLRGPDAGPAGPMGRSPCRVGGRRGRRSTLGRFRLRRDGPPGDGRIQGRPVRSRPAVGWIRP